MLTLFRLCSLGGYITLLFNESQLHIALDVVEVDSYADAVLGGSCEGAAPRVAVNSFAMVSFRLTPPPPFVSNGQHLPYPLPPLRRLT